MHRRAIWIAVVNGVILTAMVVLLVIALGGGVELNAYVLTNAVIGCGYLVPALVIAWHRPTNLLGILLALGAIGHLLANVGVLAWSIGSVRGWPGWVIGLALQAMGLAWHLGLGTLFSLLLLLFPDGRLPGPRWRWLVVAVFAQFGFAVVVWYAAPDDPAANIAQELIGLVWTVLAIGSLIGRYRRGQAEVRGQILWLVLAVLIMLVLNIERAITSLGPELFLLSFVAVPVAIGIAVVRYQLLDIRLVVSRTLTYGVLIALLLATYAGLVALAAAALPDTISPLGPAASAVIVALLLNPVRTVLQRAITRAFYGRRAEPLTVAASVAGTQDLDQVLGQLRSTLRLPRLAVCDEEGRRVAEARSVDPVPATPEIELPLRIHDEQVGSLAVSLRVGEKRLHRQDSAVLAWATGPLALFLRERRLADGLRASRAQVIRARESERALLHRELHDGLGPTLTSAAYRVDAASYSLAADPAQTAALIAGVRTDIGQAINDVRRVVYGLRPMALEERGIAGALGEQADSGGPLQVRLDVDTACTELSPAVELAAFRIASEGLANARRHSNGSIVVVRVTCSEEAVEVEVRDDGTPPETYQPGVGLQSIQDRAEELGGFAEITTTPHQWRIFARIPRLD